MRITMCQMRGCPNTGCTPVGYTYYRTHVYCEEHTCKHMRDPLGRQCTTMKAKSRDYCTFHQEDLKKCAHKWCRTVVKKKGARYCPKHSPEVQGIKIDKYDYNNYNEKFAIDYCNFSIKGFKNGKPALAADPDAEVFIIGDVSIRNRSGGSYKCLGAWKLLFDRKTEKIYEFRKNVKGPEVKVSNQDQLFKHLDKFLEG